MVPMKNKGAKMKTVAWYCITVAVTTCLMAIKSQDSTMVKYSIFACAISVLAAGLCFIEGGK